jgi:hypothetical protein
MKLHSNLIRKHNKLFFLTRKCVIIFISILFIIVSCRKPHCDENIEYRLEMYLVNETNYDIQVNLFPRADYMITPNTYHSGTGGLLINFNLSNNPSMGNIQRLYTTKDTSISPRILLNQVFDSIQIIINNSSNKVILFNHCNTYGNPFTIDMVWKYKKYLTSEPDNDCENPVELKNCTFHLDSLY